MELTSNVRKISTMANLKVEFHYFGGRGWETGGNCRRGGRREEQQGRMGGQGGRSVHCDPKALSLDHIFSCSFAL